MNARLVKLTLILCSLSLLNVAGSLHAQDTNATEATPQGRPSRGASQPNVESSPEFDIQIENGKLSLAPLKDTPEKNPWGTNFYSVSATIDNLGKYLRAVDPSLNIVLSPEVGNLKIANLKLNTRFPQSIVQAVSVASDGVIVGPMGRGDIGFGGFRGAERSLTFIANRPRESKPSVEVFNLSGYIQTLGKVDDEIIREKIDDLQRLTRSTLVDDMRLSPEDQPNFKYHPGTKLLIVVGKSEAIDLARKIINALPGQQTSGKSDWLLDMKTQSDQN